MAGAAVPLEVRKRRANGGDYDPVAKRMIPEGVPVQPVLKTPELPDTILTQSGRDLWAMVWAECYWLPLSDVPVVTRYVEQSELRSALRAELQAHLTADNPDYSNLSDTDQLKVIRTLGQLGTELTALEAKLYLNPSDRAKGRLDQMRELRELQKSGLEDFLAS
jgi:hypothetical protein